MIPAQQLAEDLDTLAFQVAGVLGLDLHPILTARIDTAAVRLVAELRDDSAATRAAQTVMNLLHGMHDPEPSWWRTPLGRLCANALVTVTAEAITYQVAADMLGVARGTVGTMMHRGTLDRHPDGGVLKSSVLKRLGR